LSRSAAMSSDKKTVTQPAEVTAENGADDMMPIRFDLSRLKRKPWKKTGDMMPYVEEEPDVHFEKVADMEIRDDDIMLVSFPKSGTHWMWRILDLIVNKTTDYGDRCTDFGFIDAQLVERVNNLASPRVLTSHVPLQYLPKQVKAKRTKLVHVYRNPKAVLVSMYFMMKTSGLMPDITLDKVAMNFVSDQGPLPKWTYYWDQVMEFENNNPDVPIFHISYEELKLVRESDDWKNYLTVATSERMDQILKDRADRCRFSAKYVNSD
ncbi:hypothetical protein BaRGS_00035708, partial [Batillaria attramentaria]